MPARRMHAHEVDEQFPPWADLPIEPVRSPATENAIFRVGDDMAVGIPSAAGDARREHASLPRIGPQLPLATPVPPAIGAPGWEVA